LLIGFFKSFDYFDFLANLATEGKETVGGEKYDTSAPVRSGASTTRNFWTDTYEAVHELHDA
jgi:hypothetical protein